jgi:hypothetical protein
MAKKTNGPKDEPVTSATDPICTRCGSPKSAHRVHDRWTIARVCDGFTSAPVDARDEHD